MKPASRVNTRLASLLLVVVAVLSALLLVYSRASGNLVVQVITLPVSMGLVFYASHPLGHFVARAYDVSTECFFVGRSDFRKLKLKPMSLIGGLTPIVGTKLSKDELASLPPRKRGYIFGAGVIVSNSFVGMRLAYVLLAGFNLTSILLGVPQTDRLVEQVVKQAVTFHPLDQSLPKLGRPGKPPAELLTRTRLSRLGAQGRRGSPQACQSPRPTSLTMPSLKSVRSLEEAFGQDTQIVPSLLEPRLQPREFSSKFTHINTNYAVASFTRAPLAWVIACALHRCDVGLIERAFIKAKCLKRVLAFGEDRRFAWFH